MTNALSHERPLREFFLIFLCLLGMAALGAEVEFSGSARTIVGGILYREGIPDNFTRDWFSSLDSSLRVRGSSGKGAYKASAWISFDPLGNLWAGEVEELSAEWMPAAGLRLGLGRSRLSFGPCQAFSPANSFSSRNPFDIQAGRRGLDGLRAGLVLGEKIPFDFKFAWLLPMVSGYPDLMDSSALALASVLLPEAGILGQTEIGLAGDLRELGTEGRRWCEGSWLSIDIAGFVLGAEAAFRSPGYAAGLKPVDDGEPEWSLAFGGNRKIGDFLALVEASWDSVEERWLGFARLSWAPQGLSLSVQALGDLQAMSARTSLEASVEASDELIIRAQASWNLHPEDWAIPGPLPMDAVFSLGAECYF
jgi:hypothetical protein